MYDEERMWTDENIDAVAMKNFPNVDKQVRLTVCVHACVRVCTCACACVCVYIMTTHLYCTVQNILLPLFKYSYKYVTEFDKRAHFAHNVNSHYRLK